MTAVIVFGIIIGENWCSQVDLQIYNLIIKQLLQTLNQFIMTDTIPAELTALMSYLAVQDEQKSPSTKIQQICLQVYQILLERDATISALEAQITKYKAQQLKNNKLVTQLQEKVAALSPNTNNTGSNFMMGSEFREYFEDFMKNSLANIMGPLISYPQAYTEYVRIMLTSVYSSMSNSIETKLTQIGKLLNLQKTASNMTTIRCSLLKILQDNNKALFQEGKVEHFAKLHSFSNEELVEISESPEFQELQEKLTDICSYMLLQEKPWHFVFPPPNHVEKFIKKEYVCIDGWIKDKDDAIVVLEGLARGDDGRHPNLRNYVIPYSEQEEDYIFKQKTEKPVLSALKQNISIQNISKQVLPIKIEVKIQQKDIQCQYSPRSSLASPGIPKQGRRIMSDKQNQVPSNMPKIPQISHQNPPSSDRSVILNHNLSKDVSCKSIQSKIIVSERETKKNQGKSNWNLETGIMKVRSLTVDQPSAAVSMTKNCVEELDIDECSILSPHYGQNLKEKEKYQSEQMEVGQSMKKSKLKSSTKAVHNLISDPSFQEIVALPYKRKDVTDQLPLKRQNSKTKKSNSRKTSMGKIVGQAIEHKENQIQKHNRQQNIKESLYKDMIKQKLGDHKEHSKENKMDANHSHQYTGKAQQNHKTDRDKTKDGKLKNKEEDRPLRIMHFKKIREKYLNL